MNNHKVIVVGCGGLGSAALYWLSREIGASVLGIEQFRLGHKRGASQDHSRIIRLAQHQSQYAALAPHAYEAFYEIERESGVQVGRGPQALEFLLEVPNRGVRGRAQEIRAVLLQAHSGQKGRELGARKDPKCALRSGRVHGITPVMEQHPEANDCFPEGAGARRTLVRSSVVRGMVIMVVQPSSNRAHSSP